MAALEKFYLRGALAVVGAYLAFLWTVTEGGVPADLGRNALLAALVGFGLGLAALLTLLWVWAKNADGAGRLPADERERLIEAKADRAGYHALDASLLVLTLVAILEMGSGEAIGPWRLDHDTTIVIALVSLSAFGGLVRMLAGFSAARRG
jgi:hypothetical protein